MTIWRTGLPCSGKTTPGHAIAERLTGGKAELLAGDALRRDREENIRSRAEVLAAMELSAWRRRYPLSGHASRNPQQAVRIGIDDHYEPPLDPEVECKTDLETIEQSVEKILRAVKT